jgi:alkylation response protein AidB-like acyl-CoA dehydrogenase
MPIVATGQARELATAFGQLLDGQLRHSILGDEYFSAGHGGLWDAIAGGGWMDLAVAEDDGGAGLSVKDLVSVAEAWGRHIVPLPLTCTMVLRAIPAVRQRVAAAGRLTLSVPGAGGCRLVPMYGVDQVCHLAWGVGPEPEPGTVPPGLEADLFAPSLPIGSGGVLRPGQSDPAVLASIATLWAAEAVGAASAAFDAAFSYAGFRQAFGRSIAEFQAVKHRVADMYKCLELARTAVLWAANSPDAPQRGVRLALELSREIIEGAIQIEGGIGFTWEAGIHFYLRHVIALDRLVQGAVPSLAGS